jgi:hypothetical protein
MTWQLWQRCQAFRCQPSDLIKLNNPLIAYFFDRGIWFFGSYVQREVDVAGERATRGVKNRTNAEALGNTARQRALAKMCGEDITKTTTGYRDPNAKKARH